MSNKPYYTEENFLGISKNNNTHNDLVVIKSPNDNKIKIVEESKIYFFDKLANFCINKIKI